MASISTVPNFRSGEQLDVLRQCYMDGEDIADEDLYDLRVSTSVARWVELTRQRARVLRRKEYAKFLGKDIDISVKLDAILRAIMNM